MVKPRYASERGTVVIQVAVFLLSLMAFSAFIVDYGVMWTSRAQVQTAADAGALAGSISLAYDSPTDFNGAKAKARAVARENYVWGERPDVQLTDVTFPPCPPGAPGVPDTCVKVDAYRNVTRGNPLPMFFGNLVGVANQGVRATATAQIATGDATDCLKPWAIVDRWQEASPPSGADQDPGAFGPTSTYDKYSDGRGNNPPYEPDLYIPPTSSSPGTGFQLPQDEGYRFAIKTGSGGATTPGTISSGWSREIRLPRSDGDWNGASTYRNNIQTCGGLTYGIAAPTTVCPANIDQGNAAYWAARGCFAIATGVSQGPTSQGVQTLIDRDPNATFNASTLAIQNSAYDPPTRSPRVVPIAAMDIDSYLATNPTAHYFCSNS